MISEKLSEWTKSDTGPSKKTSLLMPVFTREADSFESNFFQLPYDSHVTIGYRVNIKGQIYHSEDYGMKKMSCSYVVRLKCNDQMMHGIIEYFIMVNNKIYCCCRLFSNNFVSIDHSFKNEKFKNINMLEVFKSNCFNKYFYIKKETCERIVCDIKCIRNKCILIKKTNSALFTITDLINEYEHD